jgi:hypothetical protein
VVGLPAAVRDLENAMKSRIVKNTVTVYAGVGYAFVKSNTYQNGEQAERALCVRGFGNT